jgi:anti-sigma B factor antagonist
MNLKTHSSNGATILEIHGRFDAHQAPEVTAWLDNTIKTGSTHLVFNLANTTFIDSTALGAVVNGMKRCRQHQGDLRICSLQQPVRIIFELTRLDRAFTLFESEEAALQADW